jgi:carbamoyl-phosphate synthase large subunit
MFTILFTAIGRRVELLGTFTDSFRKRNIELKLVGTELNPTLSPAVHFLDKVYPVPAWSEPSYLDNLLRICAQEDVNLLIPLYEPEFNLLSVHREAFAAVGVTLLLSDQKVLGICQDKYQTAQFFNQIGVKIPETRLINQVDPDVKFPLIAKPRFGMGSIGVRKVESLEKLGKIPKGLELLFQEYITGAEYTLDVCCDLEGRIIAVVPRERLEVRGGEVTKSRIVRNQRLIDEGIYIVEKLGAAGPLNLQCIMRADQIYWLEINPRFGGGVPLSYAAGVDYPDLLYRMVQGIPVASMIGRFEDDLLMLRYDQSVFVKNS